MERNYDSSDIVNDTGNTFGNISHKTTWAAGFSSLLLPLVPILGPEVALPSIYFGYAALGSGMVAGRTHLAYGYKTNNQNAYNDAFTDFFGVATGGLITRFLPADIRPTAWGSGFSNGVRYISTRLGIDRVLFGNVAGVFTDQLLYRNKDKDKN